MAGAIAAVVASLGLTPLEAARIRAVAEPDKYRPLGLAGTLDAIAKEDADLGWKTLYAGLPSLMTRQVIFGSIKFLAFERACETLITAYATGRPLKPVSDEIAELTASQWESYSEGPENHLREIKAILDREEPDYRT